jgi:hypothetical protein
MLADGLLSMQREGVAPVFEKISAGLLFFMMFSVKIRCGLNDSGNPA